MTIVQIAVPMLRGRRRFRIEKGRRWSLIEHLMLDAVSTAPASAEDLEMASHLPRRVVVEAFIRLMRVGWVEVAETDEGAVFSATSLGLAQLQTGDLKAPTAAFGKWMAFSVDQVTGMVFRGSRGISVRSSSKIVKSENSSGVFYLDKKVRFELPDMAAVFAALESEDEVIVGLDPSPEKFFEGYAVFSVSDGIIENPPPRLSADLRAAILLKAAEATALSEAPAEIKRPLQSSEAVEQRTKLRQGLFDHGDLILGGLNHRQAFERMISQAKERIIIHSTFISAAGLDFVLPKIYSAVAKGVVVHIFWGQTDDKADTSTSRQAASAFKERVFNEGRSDQIIIHPFTTGSHAKIIIGDDGKGNYHAILGSCNWLSSDFTSFEASVRLRDPSFVGEAIIIVAGLCSASDGLWNATAGELTALGRRISARPRPGGRTAAMRILLAPDHAEIPLQARDESKQRIFVTSHRIGIAGRPMILIPTLAAAQANRHPRIECRLCYGKATGPLSGIDAAELTSQFAKKGVTIRPIYSPRLHAKVLAWDDDNIVVTSQNWLSADPSEGSLSRELGVQIVLNKIATNFVSQFDAISQTY